MKNYSTIHRNVLAGFLLMLSIMAFGQINPYMKLPEYNNFDEIPYPFEVHKVKLNNAIELAYVDEGKGDETIIFIHGLGSYLPAWKKNIAELSKDYRCIAIDLPGYGKSSKLPHSGKMSFYAEVVMQFAEALKLEKIYIAGHSMGGQIALVTALAYPDLLKGLILAAPAGFEYFTPGQKEWFRNVMTVNGVKLTPVEAIQTNLYYNFYKTPEDAEFMITDRIAMRTASDFEAYCYAVVQSVNGMVDEPVLDHLGKIKTPVLIVFGENDNLIPNRYLNPGFTKKIAQTGHAKLPNSTLVMLPKTGHFLQFENPDGFNKAVKEFIK